MQFFYLVSILGATLTIASPTRVGGPIEAIQPVDREGACVPASCTSFGCCSGNCGYWCRACGIDYSC